jgi:hypothetical protein
VPRATIGVVFAPVFARRFGTRKHEVEHSTRWSVSSHGHLHRLVAFHFSLSAPTSNGATLLCQNAHLNATQVIDSEAFFIVLKVVSFGKIVILDAVAKVE